MAQSAPTAQTPSVPSSEPHEESTDETSIRQMFPDLEPAIIHEIYVSCGNNLQATVEFLLSGGGNSSVQGNNASEAMSQSDMDEQLARQLEQEELEAAATVANRPRQARQPVTSSVPMAPGAPPNEEQTIQEQLTKLAETGKRTFNTIFEKVKEKLKEFDEPQPPEPASSQQPYYAPSRSTAATTPSGVVPHVTRNTSFQSSQPGPTASPSSHGISDQTAPGASSGRPPSAIETPKAAFLDKKPTPLVETKRSQPEEDLTENPFDDRNN